MRSSSGDRPAFTRSPPRAHAAAFAAVRAPLAVVARPNPLPTEAPAARLETAASGAVASGPPTLLVATVAILGGALLAGCTFTFKDEREPDRDFAYIVCLRPDKHCDWNKLENRAIEHSEASRFIEAAQLFFEARVALQNVGPPVEEGKDYPEFANEKILSLGMAQGISLWRAGRFGEAAIAFQGTLDGIGGVNDRLPRSSLLPVLRDYSRGRAGEAIDMDAVWDAWWRGVSTNRNELYFTMDQLFSTEQKVFQAQFDAAGKRYQRQLLETLREAVARGDASAVRQATEAFTVVARTWLDINQRNVDGLVDGTIIAGLLPELALSPTVPNRPLWSVAPAPQSRAADPRALLQGYLDELFGQSDAVALVALHANSTDLFNTAGAMEAWLKQRLGATWEQHAARFDAFLQRLRELDTAARQAEYVRALAQAVRNTGDGFAALDRMPSRVTALGTNATAQAHLLRGVARLLVRDFAGATRAFEALNYVPGLNMQRTTTLLVTYAQTGADVTALPEMFRRSRAVAPDFAGEFSALTSLAGDSPLLQQATSAALGGLRLAVQILQEARP